MLGTGIIHISINIRISNSDFFYLIFMCACDQVKRIQICETENLEGK